MKLLTPAVRASLRRSSTSRLQWHTKWPSMLPMADSTAMAHLGGGEGGQKGTEGRRRACSGTPEEEGGGGTSAGKGETNAEYPTTAEHQGRFGKREKALRNYRLPIAKRSL